jgi:nucleoid DNA-binding protein
METPGANTVTKRDLVQRIADQTGQTKVLVRDIVQSFLDEVATELVHGNRLEFRKFGVFEVRNRPGRIAQNPKTLQKVEVPAKRVVKFKVGNVLKKRVEAGEPMPEVPGPLSAENSFGGVMGGNDETDASPSDDDHRHPFGG